MAWYTSDKSGQVEGVASGTIIVTEGRDRVEIGGGQLEGKKWEMGIRGKAAQTKNMKVASGVDLEMCSAQNKLSP